jgi:hypothetical protein
MKKLSLDTKSVRVVRLFLWTALGTWMIFFMAYGLAFTPIVVRWARASVVPEWWGSILAWVLPAWIIGTNLLICIYIARFVAKKFKKD